MSDPVDEGGTDVATECAVEVRMNVMRLGVLEVELTPPSQGTPGPTTDGFSVRLRPVVDAYVVLTTTSFSGNEVYLTLLQGGLKGRTNAAGHVIGALNRDWRDAAPSIEVTEQEDRIRSWSAEPPVCDEFVWPVDLLLDREHSLFWTYDREVFETVLSELWLPGSPGVLAGDDDPPEPTDVERAASHARAIERWGFIPLAYVERFPAPPLQIPTLSATENMTIAELLLTPQSSGYIAPPPSDSDVQAHAARQAQALEQSPVGSPQHYATYRHSGVIFDVTPPALRALYTAEWVARCVVHLRKQSAEDWATLHRAGEVARAYSDGEPIREQELALFGSFGVPGHGGLPSAHAPGFSGASLPVLRDPGEIQAWVEGLRGFALACARAQVERREVSNLLESMAGSLSGSAEAPPNVRAALRALATDLGPRLTAHAQLSDATRDAALDYFDVYAYGKVLVEAGLQAECDAHAQGIDHAVRLVSSKAERLLRGGLPYDEFALALWTRIPDDAAREALHRRFEAVLLAFQVPFWGASISLERWDALRPALQWMQAATNQAASVWSALIETEVHAYAKLLQDADAANQMLNFLYLHHRVRSGETLQGSTTTSHTVWKGIVRQNQDFRIDFDTGVVELLSPDRTTSSSAPVRFVHHVTRRSLPQMATELGMRLRSAALTDMVTGFEVEVAADTRRWDTNAPTYLKALANTLNMGLIVSALHTKAQRMDLYACVDLSQGALASAESLGAVLYALNRPHGLTPLAALQGGARSVERANVLYGWAAQAGRAAGAISVFADLLGGLRVFEARSASRERISAGDAEGDVADAARRGDETLYNMYVAQGTLKLLSGTGGAVMLATGVSTGPLAVGVLVCGVLVLLCDGAIAVHQANQPAVTAFISRVYQARERELQHVERGGNADGESGTSLTARRIWTLNARLRDALTA